MIILAGSSKWTGLLLLLLPQLHQVPNAKSDSELSSSSEIFFKTLVYNFPLKVLRHAEHFGQCHFAVQSLQLEYSSYGASSYCSSSNSWPSYYKDHLLPQAPTKLPWRYVARTLCTFLSTNHIKRFVEIFFFFFHMKHPWILDCRQH
jgi:hypothetical protein